MDRRRSRSRSSRYRRRRSPSRSRSRNNNSSSRRRSSRRSRSPRSRYRRSVSRSRSPSYSRSNRRRHSEDEDPRGRRTREESPAHGEGRGAENYRSKLLYGVEAESKDTEKEQANVNDLTGLSEEEQMKRLMGFGAFDTTKGQQVEDNESGAARGAVHKGSKREYRQYMNRKGTFSRTSDNRI